MIYYEDKNVIVRDATFSDVEAMKDNLRKEEIDEVWASYHFTPEEALTFSFRHSSKVFTVTAKGEPVAMFGLVPDSLLSDRALVWQLTTNAVTRIWVRFLKTSKRMIAMLLNHYPVIYNWVDARNTKAVGWLHWCGAEIFPAEAFGLEKMAFNQFQFGRR